MDKGTHEVNGNGLPADDHPSVPVFYWLKGSDTQNFGDFLTELFLRQAFTKPRVSASAYRLIGSVVEESIIQDDLKQLGYRKSAKIAFWCCGARDQGKPRKQSLNHTIFCGARGPLTRDVLGLPKDTTLGDPAMLLPLLYGSQPSATTKGNAICVPHFGDRKSNEELLAISRADVVIRPNIKNTIEDLLRILDDIASASFVLAGSLHSAIVACAYGVPFCFWDNGHLDVPFKWRDFSASVNIGTSFVTSVEDGRYVYDGLHRKNLKRPPLFPILAAAPFHVKKQLLLAAAISDAANGNHAADLDPLALEEVIEKCHSLATLSGLEESISNLPGACQFDGKFLQTRSSAFYRCRAVTKIENVLHMFMRKSARRSY